MNWLICRWYTNGSLCSLRSGVVVSSCQLFSELIWWCVFLSARGCTLSWIIMFLALSILSVAWFGCFVGIVSAVVGGCLQSLLFEQAVLNRNWWFKTWYVIFNVFVSELDHHMLTLLRKTTDDLWLWKKSAVPKFQSRCWPFCFVLSNHSSECFSECSQVKECTKFRFREFELFISSFHFIIATDLKCSLGSFDIIYALYHCMIVSYSSTWLIQWQWQHHNDKIITTSFIVHLISLMSISFVHHVGTERTTFTSD